jgi:cell wall-associated NlpC family hydrolase
METASVRVSVAPVQASRSMQAEQVTQALLGASVRIIERSARWARIRMDDDYEGWIARAHLGPDLPHSADWVTMTDLWVNLRTRPDYRMPVRQMAFVGTRLPLLERRPGWLGVTVPSGQPGWVEEHRGQVGFSEEPTAPPIAEQVLATARRFLGVPYLWGGCSPLGLDCSGFVQLVYRLHHIRLPRDADLQAGVGMSIALDQPGALPAAGDALFFCSPDARERITHVGMALGDGSFVHAAGGDRVRINRLADVPYGGRLVTARRYLCPGTVPGI